MVNGTVLESKDLKAGDEIEVDTLFGADEPLKARPRPGACPCRAPLPCPCPPRSPARLPRLLDPPARAPAASRSPHPAHARPPV